MVIPLPSSRSLAKAVWLVPSVIAATVTALPSKNDECESTLATHVRNLRERPLGTGNATKPSTCGPRSVRVVACHVMDVIVFPGPYLAPEIGSD